MNYLQLGDSELRVSRFCLGTMTFGEQNDLASAHLQLNRAIEAGINFIDTAEMYPVPAKADTAGSTESIIGEWLQHQQRDRIVLATKVAGPNRGMNWIRNPIQLTESQIVEALDQSLKRLKTDYIDLYQIHWPARHVPMFGQSYFTPQDESHCPSIQVQLEALAKLVKAGKIRYIGVSNETPWGVCEFTRLADQLQLPRIVSIQNVYNLINRTFEQGLAETCHRERVPLLVYSPLAFGLLSGKYAIDPQTSGRMTQFPGFGVRYHKKHVPEAVAAYAALAQELSMSPAQLALAWINSRWFVGSIILGQTSIHQLDENLSSAHYRITPEIEEAIESIHRQYPSPAQ